MSHRIGWDGDEMDIDERVLNDFKAVEGRVVRTRCVYAFCDSAGGYDYWDLDRPILVMINEATHQDFAAGILRDHTTHMDPLYSCEPLEQSEELEGLEDFHVDGWSYDMENGQPDERVWWELVDNLMA